jgi:hypothetical protein
VTKVPQLDSRAVQPTRNHLFALQIYFERCLYSLSIFEGIHPRQQNMEEYGDTFSGFLRRCDFDHLLLPPQHLMNSRPTSQNEVRSGSLPESFDPQMHRADDDIGRLRHFYDFAAMFADIKNIDFEA